MRIKPVVKKERLDLTVGKKYKLLARKIAVKRRRSISALFEDLIEEESAREKQMLKENNGTEK